MNIAFFSDTYLPSKNGVATSISQLKREFEKAGHNIYIYTANTPDAEPDPKVFRSTSFDVHLKVDGRFAFANIPRINALIKKQQIDIIHTHTEFALGITGRYIARHLKIPHVHTVHTLWDDYRHYFVKTTFANRIVSPQRVDRLFRAFMSSCSALVSPSAKARAYLQRLGIRQSYIINNGVDSSSFQKYLADSEKVLLRQKLNVEEHDILVIFVGRIAQEKRAMELYDTLKLAIKQNPHIKGLFVGQGPDLEPLQELAKAENLQNNFIFTGYLPYEEVYKYYLISQIYATVSLSEVQPMTIIEALISGLPIVTRTDLAYKDLVLPGENGFMEDSDEVVAQRILELATNSAQLEQFSQKSLDHSLYFSVERQAKKLLALYEKVRKRGYTHKYYHENEIIS